MGKLNMNELNAMEDYITNHCNLSMNKALDAQRFPLWKRSCEYRVEAADGHFIQHACHTKKNNKGQVFAAGSIYSLNLKNGLLRPLCVITNGTDRHQEIPVLRTYIE